MQDFVRQPYVCLVLCFGFLSVRALARRLLGSWFRVCGLGFWKFLKFVWFVVFVLRVLTQFPTSMLRGGHLRVAIAKTYWLPESYPVGLREICALGT